MIIIFVWNNFAFSFLLIQNRNGGARQQEDSITESKKY